ncbi:MAG: TetR/AcrR family transcriptional regulator [Herbiconiux sp.]|nr:TetR/AcrR family transcriptional regulator [Herbiconiux sp.]
MSSVSETNVPKKPRMAADDRRALVVDAAMAVFGELGYHGATTDRIAKAAGVSQPYVVRMFGTKEQLFLDVLGRALDELKVAFRAAIAGDAALPLGRRLGEAYFELTANRGILLCLMHAFALGADPVIGPAARCGFLEVYRILRDEAGMTGEEAVAFLSGGMLANVVLGVRMFDDFDRDPDARELLTEVFPDKLALVHATHPPLTSASDPRR